MLRLNKAARQMTCFISLLRTAAFLLLGTGTQDQVMMDTLGKVPVLKMRFYLACERLAS